MGKGLRYCFECPDYPCKLIKNLEKSYNKRYQASLMENSEFVRQHGLERFMEQQKGKYTCPKCGGIISIHDRECSACQESMKQAYKGACRLALTIQEPLKDLRVCGG